MLVEKNKIIENDALQEHSEKLLKTIHEIFAQEFLSSQDISKTLPLIKWKGCPKAPGVLSLYFLSHSTWNRKTLLFLEEMVSGWLSSEQLNILSSRNLSFPLPSCKRSLFFVELLVHIPDEKTLHTVQERLPSFINELRLGALSSGYTKHILEMKRLSSASKTSFIYEIIVALMRRYPKRFSPDIFREVQHFLVHCREEFRQIRHVKHLCQIICAHYLFKKALEQDIKAFPLRRHLYLKLTRPHLYYPFGLKRVLGLVIVINSLGGYESFELKHILKAIQRIIPDIHAPLDAYYSQRNEEDHSLSFYLEIEKTKEGDFTIEELKRLRRELPQELKNSVEYLSPSVFIPRNEEELIRNILSLSAELRYVRDLPQAIISFHEQKGDVLKFNIVLLRILNQNSCSFQELSQSLPSNVRFILERVANVGHLRKKHTKEANVFSLEVENQLFLRKNHSVDLVKARTYVVKILEKMIGPFRDFNGGFLLKQNEQLEKIKKALGSAYKQHEFFLENLFYSLTPSVMQTCIPLMEGKTLFSLCFQALEEELPNNRACIWKLNRCKDSLAVMIKTCHSEIKEQLIEAVKQLRIKSNKIATAEVQIEHQIYLGFLFLNPSKKEHESFLQTITATIEAWEHKVQNLQILHLHLPRAAQSLDPRIGADRTSGVVIKMLYEGLSRIVEKEKVELAVAEDVHISEGGKKYLFKLKTTYWSNGSKVTAYDFEYAWKKILEPDFTSPYSFLFFPIKNAEAAKKGEKPINQVGISALDEKNLLVELEYPTPYFLNLTASWVYSPLCQEVDQKHPGWAYHSGESYVCNGPFKLDLWKLNDDLQVVKNPLYWDAESVKLDRIQLTIIDDEKTAMDMFYREELDWVGDPLNKLPLKEILKLKERHSLHSESQYYGLFWLQLNLKRLPFQSAKIRKAFAYGVDRKKLINRALFSEDIPAFGFSCRPYIPNPLPFKDGDKKTALLLFEEGLEELRLKRSNLPPLVISHSDIEEHEAASKELGRQWSELFGVEIKFERLSWNLYFDALNHGKFMMGGLAWYTRFVDPIYFYDRFVFREHAVRVTRWKNASYAEIIEQSKRTTDPQRKSQLLGLAEKILLDQMPVIPLFYQKFRYVKNPRLHGCILSNTNQIDFRKAYLTHIQKK